MRIVLKYLFAFAISLLALSSADAQYTVEANIILSPPYPTNFDAYIDYLEEGIIEINNLESFPQEVIFDIDFFETSGLLSVSTDGAHMETITLEPGVNILSPIDIQNTFSGLTEENFITSGLNQEQLNNIQLNRQLPEGTYQICLRAFDLNNQQISDPALGCVEFNVIFAERPIITSPFEGEETDTSGFLLVTWDHNINNPIILDRLDYTLKIIDLTEQEIQNIQLAMLDPGLSPDYEEDLGNQNTVNLLNDVDLPLIVGHQYAMRVTAIDPDEGLGFQFGGHSEIVTFWYGLEGNVGGGADLPIPEITSPTNGDAIDITEMEDLVIEGAFAHNVNASIVDDIKYTLRIIDITDNNVDEVDAEDFTEGSYDLFYEGNIEGGAFKIESTISDSIVANHEYALLLTAASDDGSVSFEDNGNSEIVSITLDYRSIYLGHTKSMIR